MRGDGGDSPEGEYERYRAPVLGMLAKRFPRLDADERLSIYHDAWTRVLAKRQHGERFVSLRAYLLATAGAEALHAVSRGKVPTPVGPDDPRLAGLVDAAPPLDEQVVTRDQARIARNLLDTLDERQRDVLKLRWDLQLTASEIRVALGLSERQYRRLAEEGAAALAERVEQHESGQWSRRTRSLLVACLVEVTRDGERSVGIASRRQREEAQRLLETDPHVAALYAEVRRTARGAAALLPMPLFLGDRGSVSLLAQLGETIASLRGQLVDSVQSAKQQATSLYVRATDPTLLTGGPRPSAAAVAVAGVLAVGGGTYGAHKTVSATSPAPGPAASAQHVPAAALTPPAKPPTPRRHSPTRARPSEPRRPVATPPPATASQPAQPSPSPPRPAPTPPQPSPPTEFGFED
jgi:DNA-directed RNA polymerase specialized sigma24 family protein